MTAVDKKESALTQASSFDVDDFIRIVKTLSTTPDNQNMSRAVLQSWIESGLSNIAPTGLTGATQASRYVGATTSGAPVSGTFAVGDFIIDRTGSAWVCTIAGTPGTWTQLGSGGGGGAGINYAINGGLDFAQRNLTPTTLFTVADKSYGPDRFWSTRENADLQYQQVDATGETGLTSKFYGTYKKITNTGKFFVTQVIEGVNSVPLRSKTVIFQIKMKASASKTIRIAVLELQNAGTMDAPPATLVTAFGSNTVDPTLGANVAVVTGAQSCSVTTSWQSFSVSVTCPSNSKNFMLAFWTDSQFAANDTLSFAEVGFFVASSVQAWTPIQYGDQLTQIERYCEVLFDSSSANIVSVVAFKSGAAALMSNGIFRTRKRVVPTFANNVSGWSATASPTGVQAGSNDTTAGAAITITGTVSANFDLSNTTQFRWYFNASTSFSGTAADIVDMRLGPSVLIYASAEIL